MDNSKDERWEFPKYESEELVFCIFCKLRITKPFQASGFPPGRGEWRGQCTSQDGCRKVTYFDWSALCEGRR